MSYEEKLRYKMQRAAANLFRIADELDKHNKAKNKVMVETRKIDEAAIYLSQKSREI